MVIYTNIRLLFILLKFFWDVLEKFGSLLTDFSSGAKIELLQIYLYSLELVHSYAKDLAVLPCRLYALLFFVKGKDSALKSSHFLHQDWQDSSAAAKIRESAVGLNYTLRLFEIVCQQIQIILRSGREHSILRVNKSILKTSYLNSLGTHVLKRD